MYSLILAYMKFDSVYDFEKNLQWNKKILFSVYLIKPKIIINLIKIIHLK